MALMTARKKGGTCIVVNKEFFRLGRKYLAYSPEPNVLNIKLYRRNLKVVCSTFSKPVVVVGRKDGGSVALSLGKFLEPGDTVDLISLDSDEMSLRINRGGIVLPETVG